jgi:hypothetical protein
MSQQAITEFLQRAAREPALQARLPVPGPAGTKEQVLDKIVAVAAAHGHAFTVAALDAHLAALAAGPLDDAQLDAAAGGGWILPYIEQDNIYRAKRIVGDWDGDGKDQIG